MSAGLRRWAVHYLELRARAGYRTDDHRRLLADFLDYLDRQHSSTIRVCDALTWAVQPQGTTSGWRAHRLAAVRSFAAHIHASEPDAAELIPPGLLPARRNRHVPYLYTDTQIAALILGAQHLAPSVRGQTLATVIGLMAATGMRTSEAVGLNTTSLDARGGTIRVLGKGGSHRVLPVHPSTVTALGDYIRLSRALVGEPPAGSLFVTQQATRPSANSVQQAFRRVADGCRLPIPPGRRPPRLHDLRSCWNSLLVELDVDRTCCASRQQDVPNCTDYFSHSLFPSESPEMVWGLVPQQIAHRGTLHYRCAPRSDGGTGYAPPRRLVTV